MNDMLLMWAFFIAVMLIIALMFGLIYKVCHDRLFLISCIGFVSMAVILPLIWGAV